MSVVFEVSIESGFGFVAGLASALAFTPVMRWLAWKTHFVCEFNPVVNEARPSVAYLGGIAILTAASVSAFVLQIAGVETMMLARLLTAALPLTILGLLDDRLVLSPAPKAALEVVCAGLGIWLTFGWHASLLQFMGAIFVTVTLVNAVNFLDASDAFAASVVAATFLAIGVLAGVDVVPMLVLVGAVAGFLVFNRPPANIYLGDAGSHFLGAIMAFEILDRFVFPGVPLKIDLIVAAAALVAVPLFDVVFTVCVRIWKRRPWWRGSLDHTVFRMRASGLSKGGAAGVIFFVQLAFGGLGAAILGANASYAALGGLGLGLSAAMAAVWLLQFAVMGRPTNDPEA